MGELKRKEDSASVERVEVGSSARTVVSQKWKMGFNGKTRDCLAEKLVGKHERFHCGFVHPQVQMAKISRVIASSTTTTQGHSSHLHLPT